MILVVADHFRIGGRETHIYEFVNRFERIGKYCGLATRTLVRETREAKAFRQQWTLDESDGPVPSGTSAFCELLKRAGEQEHPECIWAHHFDLLGPWMIGKTLRVPVVTSFHGPLFGDGRPNDPIQALGMTLAIHRGGPILAVSQEIINNLRDSGCPENRIHFLPNAIHLPNVSGNEQQQRRSKLILATRIEKYEHIRAACQILAEYRRHVRSATLTLVCPFPNHPTGELAYSGLGRVKFRLSTITQLLGRNWCLNQGTHFCKSLTGVRLYGGSTCVPELIESHDIVLGMGRAVLEGLAARKICCLIGYQSPIGVVTDENFEQFQTTNFSGRGVPATSAQDIAGEIASDSAKPISEKVLATVSMSAIFDQLTETLDSLGANDDTDDSDLDLATRLVAAANGGASDDQLFAIGCHSLSEDECRTLHNLIKG